MMAVNDVKVDTVEIFRSGPGLTMVCTVCDRTFPVGRRLTLRQLLELAAGHQKTCPAKT